MLPRDIANLKRRLIKTGTSASEAEAVQGVLEKLTSEDGHFQFATREDGVLDFLGLMSKTMQEYVTKYPEILVMDCHGHHLQV